MILTSVQLRVLIMKFDNADVWKKTCDGIDWTNIYKNSFLQDLNDDTRLRSFMIRVAICSAEQKTPYSKLCLNINEGGSVTAELKVRIDRMKLVYQIVNTFVTITDEDRQYRRDKLWEYLEDDIRKWGT
jgi:hypothetical protein